MADFIDPLGALAAPPASHGGAGVPAGGAGAVMMTGGGAGADAGELSPSVHPLAATTTIVVGDGAGVLGPSTAGHAVSSATHTAKLKHSPYLEWSTRRAAILKEFTVTGSIAVSANFMAAEGDEDSGDPQQVPLAKAKQRLEQLEAAARGVATIEMSQAEYVKRIERLHKGLQNAWDNNHRVLALKIAIQCAKLLGEHRVPQFYPSMFVMVTAILDTFGKLVFDRLKAIADEEHKRMTGTKSVLPEDFIAADVGGEARETCRNWMFKTACIRELLPRIYVEMALLECYRFIYDADFAAILMRLAHSIRGIGNPVVATYARLYLARMATKLVRDDNRQRESVMVCISDFMHTYKDIASPARESMLMALGITMPVYLQLFQPALAWQMHQLAWGANRDVFLFVLQRYRELCGNSMVLQLIIDAFDPYFYAPHVTDIMALIADAKPSLINTADLYRSLATQLVKQAPPAEFRIPFLNEAWKAITSVGDPIAYARNAAALVDLLQAYYTERETLLLLGDLVKRMQASGTTTGHSGEGKRSGRGGGGGGAFTAPPASLPHLERILTTLVEGEVTKAHQAALAAPGTTPKFSPVLTSQYFTALFDMFDVEHKPALSKAILTSLTSVPGSITDPVVVNTMLEVARSCHDSLDVLSSDDEQRTISNLICAFISKVDLGRDLERQLEVLVDCRQSFPNLDAVKVKLVMAAVELSMKALKLVKGRHTAKTSAFVKSVFAYIAISIPAIDDPFQRMHIYQQAGIAALHNQCVAQGDMLLRGVVQEIPDLPASLAVAASLSTAASTAGPGVGGMTNTATDTRLVELVKGFVSNIVPAPGHPEHGPFYLPRGLFNALQKYPWSDPTRSPLKTAALASLLPLLRDMTQDPLPTHIPGLDSNDVLYAGDLAYKEEAVAFLRAVVETLVTGLVEVMEAAKAGDMAAKGNIIPVCTTILAHTAAILTVDGGAAPAVEKVCLELKSVAPEHPALKDTVAMVLRLRRA